jgi:hypothetical protein
MWTAALSLLVGFRALKERANRRHSRLASPKPRPSMREQSARPTSQLRNRAIQVFIRDKRPDFLLLSSSANRLNSISLRCPPPNATMTLQMRLHDASVLVILV